jgi:hypothetical protein
VRKPLPGCASGNCSHGGSITIGAHVGSGWSSLRYPHSNACRQQNYFPRRARRRMIAWHGHCWGAVDAGRWVWAALPIE